MYKNITDIPLNEMPKVILELGLKKFAADQIITWLYRDRASSFDEMTNLSKSAREILKAKFKIESLKVEKVLEAADGTKKFLCLLEDNNHVECVLIPSEDRRTVCISTQVGCAMGCGFCRTAEMGFTRDLTQGEILGQLLIAVRESPIPVTNIVLMGMGEPLNNMEAVSSAVEIMLEPRAFCISKRKITLSTAGLIPKLKEFCRRLDIRIAISLNATTDEVRNKIMPVNKKYSIAEIMQFSREYSKDSRNVVTFEYVLIRDLNDTDEDVKRLVRLLKDVSAKVNLIPFNPFEGCSYDAPLPETIDKWSTYLREHEIRVNIRASKGQEIMAACGQLAGLE